MSQDNDNGGSVVPFPEQPENEMGPPKLYMVTFDDGETKPVLGYFNFFGGMVIFSDENDKPVTIVPADKVKYIDRDQDYDAKQAN